MKTRHLILSGLLMSGIIFFLNIQFLSADSNYFEFDDHLSYNIYFYSGENHTAVIEHAAIEGFQDIAGNRAFKQGDGSLGRVTRFLKKLPLG